MLIGILQCGHYPDDLQRESGDYGDMFQRLLSGQGFDFALYPVVDDIFPADAEACDGWLITGSRHGAYEDLPWIPPLEELIRQIHAAGRPLVGICFGHQIIAQAMGGKVEKFTGGWSVGRQTYRNAEGTFSLNAWHQDQVTERPPGARVIAESDFCANAALAYGERTYTIQPHPEFSDTEVTGLLETRGPGLVPDALIASANASLGGSLDTTAEVRRLTNTLKGISA